MVLRAMPQLDARRGMGGPRALSWVRDAQSSSCCLGSKKHAEGELDLIGTGMMHAVLFRGLNCRLTSKSIGVDEAVSESVVMGETAGHQDAGEQPQLSAKCH